MRKVGTAKQIIYGFITLGMRIRNNTPVSANRWKAVSLGRARGGTKLLLRRVDTKAAISDVQTHESKEKHTKEYKLV